MGSPGFSRRTPVRKQAMREGKQRDRGRDRQAGVPWRRAMLRAAAGLVPPNTEQNVLFGVLNGQREKKRCVASTNHQYIFFSQSCRTPSLSVSRFSIDISLCASLSRSISCFFSLFLLSFALSSLSALSFVPFTSNRLAPLTSVSTFLLSRLPSPLLFVFHFPIPILILSRYFSQCYHDLVLSLSLWIFILIRPAYNAFIPV